MSQTDKPTLSLDQRGEHCPYNANATLETQATLQPGERLEVVTDCAQSVHALPEEPQ
ncbi:sulfurtransferase TusA family protein, partial [Pseudomonas aeruginosa]